MYAWGPSSTVKAGHWCDVKPQRKIFEVWILLLKPGLEMKLVINQSQDWSYKYYPIRFIFYKQINNRRSVFGKSCGTCHWTHFMIEWFSSLPNLIESLLETKRNSSIVWKLFIVSNQLFIHIQAYKAMEVLITVCLKTYTHFFSFKSQ